MRITVTGATGNVGTAVVRALIADHRVDEIVGIARRRPDWAPPKVRWVQADVARDPLHKHFEGSDVVLHLAWLIQPSRDVELTDFVNIQGSRRVFEAAGETGVGALVHASSVAAYSPAKPGTLVDESWPVHGIPTSYYSRQKVAVERILDQIEERFDHLRVARARPGLIFQRSAAAEIRRYFGGPLVPGWAARRKLIPFVPQLTGLVGQVLHADDMGELYRLLCLDPSARGAYNAAAGPPLDAAVLADLFGARPLPLPTPPVRALVKASWRARLQPVSPDWIDVAIGVPVMSTGRARQELGWGAAHDARAVILELMDGLRAHAGFNTPPLQAHSGGWLRQREFATGVGGPNPQDAPSGGS
jgi:UDP-glucose 4-epimerase